MAYTTGVRADPDGVLRQIHAALDSFDLGVTTANREFSPGQFEINLAHADALAAADRAFLLEEIVKESPRATACWRPSWRSRSASTEGSSHHVHVSLWRGDENAFAGDGGGLRAARVGVRGRRARTRPGTHSDRLPDDQLVQAARASSSLVPAGRVARRRQPAELPAHPGGARARAPRRGARGGRIGEPVPADRGDPRCRPRRDRAPARSGRARHDGRCRRRSTTRSTRSSTTRC